jgi:hypothetical protein
MSQRVSALLLIAALLLLFFWCGLHHAPRIEASLASRANHVLVDLAQRMSGPGVTVGMDGRIATLMGTIDSEDKRQEVLRRVGTVAGIRQVRDQLQVATLSSDTTSPMPTTGSGATRIAVTGTSDGGGV